MYKLLLCVRYLRTKYIALACIISVMLGVATMIVVNSVMAGFANEMRDRLHNFLADIVVEARSLDGVADSELQMAIVNDVAGDYIAAMTRTVEIPGMITFTDPYSGEAIPAPVTIHGIDPVGKALVGPLQDYLDSYNPVVEDGVVVRDALRSPDEPLGWDLTEPAAEYRRQMKQQQTMYLNSMQYDPLLEAASPINRTSDSTEAAAQDPVSQEEPDFDDREPDKAVVIDTNQSSDAAAEAASLDAQDDHVPALIPQILEDDPFGNAGIVDAASVNTQPLPARIYLGEGIVSFQAQDENGKLHKVMMVNPGDDVILSTVTSTRPPDIVKFQATVVDSFRSGMSEYDQNVVLMNISELQKNRGMIVDGVDAITGIHIKLKNYEDAETVVALLKGAFPPGAVNVRTWEEKQGLLLSAVEVETAILNVLLFMIIAVAGFGILAIFFMIVVEKTRDIGILKSLGASSRGVMSIFLSYGLALGIVGSAAGVAIGLLFVHYINEIEDGLSWLTGRKVFDEKIYYFFEIPTEVSSATVFWVAFGAIAIAVLASVLPARRASRLHPVRALRYE
jgi:lipoprotein-releasing system permease protein